MLLRAAQARAVLLGRDFVVPDDIQALTVEVLGHRMVLRSVSASADDIAHIIREIVAQTEVPV